MEKLIEVRQENLIVCDNEECDYVVPINSRLAQNGSEWFINTGCPKCNQNLLTQKDHDDGKRLVAVIEWVNKWFSWITFFTQNNKAYSTKIKVHNGIKIIEDAKNKNQ